MAVLLLAGCSDDDDDSAAPPTTAAGAPTTVRPVDTSFTGQGGAEFCELLATFTGGQEQLSANASPDELRAAFGESITAINQAAGVAPDEIKADVDTVAASMKSFETAMSNAGYDVTKVNAADLAALQSQAFLSSVTRMGAYLSSVCQRGAGG
ncbi:MAG TPA: hypothetical protein VF244_04200 [Acidimicrobiales bacterium]